MGLFLSFSSLSLILHILVIVLAWGWGVATKVWRGWRMIASANRMVMEEARS